MMMSFVRIEQRNASFWRLDKNLPLLFKMPNFAFCFQSRFTDV